MRLSTDVVLSEEHRLLQDSAISFFTKEGRVEAFRKARDSGAVVAFQKALWQQATDLGWSGLAIPEAQGGYGLGLLGCGLLLEEAGRNLTPLPLSVPLGFCPLLISRLGTGDQSQALLPKVISGDALVVLAVDECAHHKLEAIATTCRRVDGGFRLSGSKTWVIDGSLASHFLVVAKVEGKDTASEAAFGFFLCEASAEGLASKELDLVDQRPMARIDFNDVGLGEDALIGGRLLTLEEVDRDLDGIRVLLAAELLGIAQQAFEITLEYLQTREQFGQTLGSFQSLQHRAARMFSELELTRSAVYEALRAMDEQRDDAPILVTAAKVLANETARLVTAEAIQMHGGIGMTDEHVIGFYLKRARVCEALFGSTRMLLLRHSHFIGLG